MSKSVEKTITIIGLGNPMAGDDGVGPRVIERLRHSKVPSLVRLETISAPGPEMVELLDAPGEVWFIDAARAVRSNPGYVLRKRIHPGDPPALESSAHLVSTHGLSLAELLRLATALGRRKAEVRLWGIVGTNFEAGNRLSGDVERSAKNLTRELLKELGVGPEVE